MDYQTKPTSRKDLRRFSKILRSVFGVPPEGAFPILFVLDKLHLIFKDCTYDIVEDDKLPPKTMAQCTPNDDGGFIIEIKSSVYKGAYEGNSGACLGFICHELCHVFLFKIGFRPIYERSFDDSELPAYCSVEWQAKALCAEVMIPYEESHGMTVQELVDTYHVSQAFAKARRKLDNKTRKGVGYVAKSQKQKSIS